MTNEEEKILEEILDEGNDITLEEAAEEAEDLQEETQDEGRAIERREDADIDQILERPVLRGRLRDAADPNMIQKHVDNFLAKISGETPVDSNVRTSDEYWLNRIAARIDGIQDEIDDMPAQKQLWWHGIQTYEINYSSVNMVILNDSSDAINTIDKFLAWIDAIVASGVNQIDVNVSGVVTTGGTSYENIFILRYSAGTTSFTFYYSTPTGYTSINFSRSDFASKFTNWIDNRNRVL